MKTRTSSWTCRTRECNEHAAYDLHARISFVMMSGHPRNLHITFICLEIATLELCISTQSSEISDNSAQPRCDGGKAYECILYNYIVSVSVSLSLFLSLSLYIYIYVYMYVYVHYVHTYIHACMHALPLAGLHRRRLQARPPARPGQPAS